jgi:hypothetical protein
MWHQNPRIAETFWMDPRSEGSRIVKKAFGAYSRWEKQHHFRRPTLQRGILPGDFAATVTSNETRVGIVGLNTAFLQLTDEDYEGRLSISVEQIRTVCGDDFTDWFDRHSFCFLMTHHPPNWLCKDSSRLI